MSEPTPTPTGIADLPDTAGADEQALAALADEFAARLRRGEGVTVDDYAAEHPELAERIRRVFPAIAAIEGAGDLGGTLGSGAAAGTTDPPGERPGSTIGRYKLLERIGEGGFGVVYMAEQHHPVRRKVALKVVKPGMDSRQVLARFEAERQALAIMDHPNIAKVFDGGMTDAGRPYFVMELVKGEPITEYCDRNQVAPRARLELFVQVCNAVQHAHQKGIIHRDLKPTNVLVALHDDATPVVKVIDFGIAKALGQELTDRTLFTGFAQLVGTPLYMSPEQAGESTVDVDTRSDIYSLGVLLYELLTGTTPFDKERFRQAAQDEIRRIIREEDPPRPSTRLSESKERLPSISAQRHTEPGKLTKLVRGELDWIVMRALEKDRARRYETANGLAKDVQRYLQDEPVQACPPSATYRLRKFGRRYRVPLAVAASFLLLLVAAVVVSTYQAVRIGVEQQNTLAQKAEVDRQRLRAEQERDRAVAAEEKAVTEARKSEQVAAFMTDMLKGVKPGVALGRDTTLLREILETTAKRLDQMSGQPAVEAELRTVIGGVYLDLADFRNAESMFRSALVLRRQTLGDKHADVARSLSDLAEALRKQNRFSEAGRLFAEALAIQRGLLGSNNPALVLTLYRLGMMHNRMGNGAEAERLIREALAIYRQHHGDRFAGLQGQLATSLSLQRKYAEAELVALEDVEWRRKRAPSGDPSLALALFNLGEIIRAQNLNTRAEPYIREALQLQRGQLPPGHDSMLWSINSLVWVLIATDRLDEAKPLIDEFVRFAGDRYPYWRACAGMFECLALSYGGNEEAEGLLRRCVELRRKIAQSARTGGNAELATTLYHYGSVASNLGMHREAEQHLTEALDTRRKELGQDHPDTISTMKGLASLYRKRGTLLRQESRFREAAEDFGKVTELDPGDHLNLYEAAAVHLYLGDVERYRRACAGMLALAEKPSKEQREIVRRTAKACAVAAGAVPDFSQVERLAERSLADAEEASDRRWALFTSGLTAYRAGHHQQAVEDLKRFAPQAKGTHCDGSGFAILAMAHHGLGQADAARASLDAARAILAKRPEDAMRDWAWRDWLHCEILLREAEQLLAK